MRDSYAMGLLTVAPFAVDCSPQPNSWRDNPQENIYKGSGVVLGHGTNRLQPASSLGWRLSQIDESSGTLPGHWDTAGTLPVMSYTNPYPQDWRAYTPQGPQGP